MMKTGRQSRPVETFWEDNFLSEFDEVISEEEARELWTKSAPIRDAVRQALDSRDEIPREVADRTEQHLARLESEINTPGGALGGSVRSYVFALIEFVDTYTIQPAIADNDDPALEDLKVVLDGVRNATTDPLSLGRLLDAIEKIGAAVNEKARLAMAAALELPGVLLDSLRNATQDISEGLKEHQGLTLITAMMANSVGGAFLKAGMAAASVAASGATAVLGTILIMAHHTYRLRNRFKPDPEQDEAT